MGVSGCPALEELGKHSDEVQFAAKTSAGFTFGADSTLVGAPALVDRHIEAANAKLPAG